MEYCDPRKQAALTTGLTLITSAVFGFVLLSFSGPIADRDGGMTIATVVVDGVTVQIKP